MKENARIPVTVECSDGYPLDATFIDSSAFNAIEEQSGSPQKKGVIVFASALGVDCSHYFKLAEYFAQQGFDAICFNYRGTGKRPANYSEFTSSLADWGRRDVDAIIRHASTLDLPIYYIGHSIGGQLLPLSDSSHRVQRAILLAASAPYWARWPGLSKIKLLLTCKLILPAAASCYRDFPSAKFGLGNLVIPSNLVNEWCRWMSKPDYFLEDSFGLGAKAMFRECEVPIRAYAFSDDAMAPLANIEKLVSFWGGDKKEIAMRNPEGLKVKRIGHSGFLRPNFQTPFWEELSDFLSR